MARLLITGQTGFVGTTLLNSWHLIPAAKGFCPVVPHEDFDVCKAEAWDELLSSAEPDAILHLAAQSHVPTSVAQPRETLEVNLMGTLELLLSLKRANFKGRLLYVSSADVYGMLSQEQFPVTESVVPAPRNPYAVSKLAAEALCRQFAWTEGLDVVLARPFNHSGAGQSQEFVLSGFARASASVALGLSEPIIAVGDLDVTRDFLHVLDVLEAYFLLMAHGQSGEIYNICSGKELLLREALNGLIAMAGVDVELRIESGRLRRAEQRRVQGGVSKLVAATGWQPRRSTAELLADLYEYWIRKLKDDA